MRCVICQESIGFINRKTLPCNHSFCLNCLRKQKKTSDTNRIRCALCRKEAKVNLNPVFNYCCSIPCHCICVHIPSDTDQSTTSAQENMDGLTYYYNKCINHEITTRIIYYVEILIFYILLILLLSINFGVCLLISFIITEATFSFSNTTDIVLLLSVCIIYVICILCCCCCISSIVRY